MCLHVIVRNETIVFEQVKVVFYIDFMNFYIENEFRAQCLKMCAFFIILIKAILCKSR